MKFFALDGDISAVDAFFSVSLFLPMVQLVWLIVLLLQDLFCSGVCCPRNYDYVLDSDF